MSTYNVSGDWLAAGTQGGYLTYYPDPQTSWPDMTDTATAKAYLGIDPGDTTYDVKIAYWITYLSQAIQGYVWRFLPSTALTFTARHTVCPSGPSSYCGPFTLPFYPIISVDDILIDTVSESDLTVYTVDAQRGMVRPPASWSASSTIEIQYTAGYATVPADIMHVLFGQLEQVYANSFLDPAGGNTGSIKTQRLEGVASVSYYNAPSSPSVSGSGAANVFQPSRILERYRNNVTVI